MYIKFFFVKGFYATFLWAPIVLLELRQPSIPVASNEPDLENSWQSFQTIKYH